MHDDVALAGGGHVLGLTLDLDAAEMHAAVVAQTLVMIAGDKHDPRALARLAQQLLQHVVMRLRPNGPPLHAPEVDDVADQIDGFGVVMLQEVQEHSRLGSACSKMQIRDE